MDQIKVGARVRSYDFPGRTDCYVEGVVEAIGPVEQLPGCDRYTIKVERAVVGSTPSDVLADRVYPPVNGTPSWLGGVCEGVVLVGP